MLIHKVSDTNSPSLEGRGKGEGEGSTPTLPSPIKGGGSFGCNFLET